MLYNPKVNSKALFYFTRASNCIAFWGGSPKWKRKIINSLLKIGLIG